MSEPSGPVNQGFIIIGAGMSGLCFAIRLKMAGVSDITVLEKSHDVGGTWLENSYPNCGCDVPSFLYSFSFAPNHNWSQKYARQPEILQYFRDCADRFDVRRHIRFGTTVESARWDKATRKWIVHIAGNEPIQADFLVTAVGQLNRPRIPDIPGADEFTGDTWHSARWNHSVDLRGKRVAVIGNGASSIQFIPTVADQASQLYLVQRSASWIHPLSNYRYGRWARWCFKNLPFAARLHRLMIFIDCEWQIIAFKERGWPSKAYRWWLMFKMKSLLRKDLQENLIPDYAPGCKRILLSSDYLQTLCRENVRVVVDPVTRFDGNSLVTDKESLPVDAVIYGTGFEASELLQPIQITGQDGILLHDTWKDHPKTLYGIMSQQFPNLFLLYGPNTNLGHNSIIFMVENQVNYILKCLQRMRDKGWKVITPRTTAVERYDANLQKRLKVTVWAGGCSSWYKKADGTIPNNWHSSAGAYARILKRPDFNAYEFE